MDFETPERVADLNARIDSLVEDVVEPLEAEHAELLGPDQDRVAVDEDNRLVDEWWEVSEEIRKESVDRGIYNAIMPEEYGGLGLSWLEFEMVIEHLYDRRNPGFHKHIIRHDSTPMLLNLPEELHDDYLYPTMDGDLLHCFAMTEPTTGSDPRYMDATAEKDGDEWVINGTKRWVTFGPYADFHVVFARSHGEKGDPEGITAFVVDADQDGIVLEEIERVMGGVPGEHCTFRYDDVRVPEGKTLGAVGEGLTGGMDWINYGKVYDAGRALGQSQWALDKSVAYATERDTWGEPLADRQAIRFKLADMRRRIESARWLTRKSCWEMDQQGGAHAWQAMMKVEESNMFNDVVDEAIQIHGGAGYVRKNPLEWLYRHARVYRIWEGADEVMKRTVAKDLLDGATD
ncbi:acyl-CoA dehydrogenase family protein [Halobacteriales archaeon Cl-PHB]